MDWREEGVGACTEHDPDLWFAAERSHDATIAMRICREECLVREICMAHALERPEHHGIWGGLTESERNRLRTRGGTKFTTLVSSQVQANDERRQRMRR